MRDQSEEGAKEQSFFFCKGSVHAFITDSHFIQDRSVYVKVKYYCSRRKC